MTNRQHYVHYLTLCGLIILGAVLRFWHLDLKPLWMDEVITAIFSLGRNYQDLPLGELIPLEKLQDIFTLKSGVSCPEIAENVARESTHPPVFFCVMYYWLSWLEPLAIDSVTKLRSLSAVCGVGAIVVIYGLNRLAFSPKSGMIAAALMAVSPFAVYLSQEARHYTLPMLFITLSLLLLIQIQKDVSQGRWRFWLWPLWVTVNIIGFYIHYFFVFVFIAEIATLIVLINYHKFQLLNNYKFLLILTLSISTVVISFLPWMVVTLNHAQRSETNWLNPPTLISPIYQILMNFIIMVVFMPVENQPLIVQIISGCLMLAFAVIAGRQVFRLVKNLWLDNKTHLSTFTILSLTGFILLQTVAISFFTHKDITSVPRYSFVYYPSFCGILAAALTPNLRTISSRLLNRKFSQRKLILAFIIIGLLSSIFVIFNLGFQKPFQPEKVAQNINLEPSSPVMFVSICNNHQDVALALSFGLAVQSIRANNSHGDSFVALSNNPDLSKVWHKLTKFPKTSVLPRNLWIVGGGIPRESYPQKLLVSGDLNCQIDLQHHYRNGIPHQLYRCDRY